MLKLALLLIFFTFSTGQRYQNSQTVPSYNNYNQNSYQRNLGERKRSLNCPEKTGRFPTGSCDTYIECIDGVPEEKTCPDGLLFSSNYTFGYPCLYPNEVDCRGRASVQPAQPTEDCPHQFGYYKLGDARNCGQFLNCANGVAYVFDCPEGLAYNEETYKCDWPDQVPSCDAEAYLGFTCPPTPRAESGLGEEELRFFRSNTDCQHYFLCVKGRPRLQKCEEGKAFNEATSTCEDELEVPGCSTSSLSQQRSSAYSNQFGRTVPPQRNNNRGQFSNIKQPVYSTVPQNNYYNSRKYY